MMKKEGVYRTGKLLLLCLLFFRTGRICSAAAAANGYSVLKNVKAGFGPSHTAASEIKTTVESSVMI